MPIEQAENECKADFRKGKGKELVDGWMLSRISTLNEKHWEEGPVQRVSSIQRSE